MNQVTEQEIVEIVKAHLSKMGWEYASHPELKPMFDLYTRIEAHGIALPDGMVLVKNEPVSSQYQGRNGDWCNFINAEHYQNTKADGSWPIRYLYAAALEVKP